MTTELESIAAQPMSDAFAAGLRSAEPDHPIEGILVHHRDQVVSDQRLANLEQLKKDEPGPANPRDALTLCTPASFAAAVGDHATDQSAIFADPKSRVIRAIFDHVAPIGAEHDGPRSGWGQFTARMKLEPSRKLREWARLNEWTEQVEFADFLEDHLEDSINPTGTALLEIATDLEASESGSFKGRVNLSNGNVALHYQSDTETTVEVPRELQLGIPLFEHGDPYKLKARLRFRVSGAGVKFRVLFTNLDDAIDQEFERIVQELEEAMGRKILRGNSSINW